MVYFRYWLTPVLVKPLFYIGSVACISWGLYLSITNSASVSIRPEGRVYTYGNSPMVALGWAWMVFGPLCLRIVCETISAIFLLHEATEKAKDEPDKRPPRPH